MLDANLIPFPGWGKNIDRKTWDIHQGLYYSGNSSTSSSENLLAKEYDDMLERMLPYFTYARYFSHPLSM
jgi:hypothetical protein